ncbi:trihelix transcription factor GT-2-like [Aristolochia californica]|uniref:trihelix transcription factor GT-2-like n=1 Tax=Aristolochia californica TaxID=171875 RepID=UPI0035DC2F78
MQSGYGVPEIQQFMVDSCASLLSISHDIGNPSQQQKHHQHHPQQQQQQIHQRFHHLSPIPITQQFFQHHPFHAFQHQQHPPPPPPPQQQRRLHQQLGLDQESGPENTNSPSRIEVGLCQPHFLGTNFKLGVNENSCNRKVLHEENTILRSDDGSDSRPVHPRWQDRDEESAIKEPFWKPLDIEYLNRNSKRCKEKLEVSTKYCEKGEEGNETEEGKSSGSNYGFFSELEAIYTRSGGGGGSTGGVANNQAGSGSALTGDNNGPTNTATAGPASAPHNSFDHGSETSTGEEASLKMLHKNRRKRKRKHMNFFASFFQSVVKQLMDHQESLHRKFLEVMERRNQERSEKEEAWRRQEAAKANREAMARVQEQALASSREAAIISFLEKITGESINLPSKTQFRINSPGQEDHKRSEKSTEHLESLSNDNNTNNNGNRIIDSTNTRRWPKAEVHALIRVRSSLESRFQEPGLKAPLWEEVSRSMASLGYQRSSKRCKEKWENINKYFRKTKDSAKKRPQQSKTCPYFHQLDQLYSKSQNASTLRPSVIPPKDNSELLDAIVVPSDQPNPQNSSLDFVEEKLEMCTNFKFPEMGSLNLDFNGSDNNCNEATELNAGQVLLQLQQEQGNEEADDGDEDEDEQDMDEGGEEEGESQDHEENQKEQEEKERLQREHVLPH